MKVKISYVQQFEKEIDITPEEYCICRASLSNSNLFPEDSSYRTISLLPESQEELDSYVFNYEQKLYNKESN